MTENAVRGQKMPFMDGHFLTKIRPHVKKKHYGGYNKLSIHTRSGVEAALRNGRGFKALNV